MYAIFLFALKEKIHPREIRSPLLVCCCDFENTTAVFCRIIRSNNLIAIIQFQLMKSGFCVGEKKNVICLNVSLSESM